MNEMTYASVAFHETLEDNFIVTVLARPEAEVFWFRAML